MYDIERLKVGNMTPFFLRVFQQEGKLSIDNSKLHLVYFFLC